MLASTKGIYVILMQLDKVSDISAGKRRFHLESGFYGYVGSALSGLERRVARHLRTDKRSHWHIDYLLNVAKVTDVICGETVESKECALAEIFSRRLPAVNGFGASDCKCPSHLFYCRDQNDLKNITLDAFRNMALRPFMLVIN
jgi:Uri superfamily endonuclease